MRAMAMDVHDELRAAWQTIIAERDRARKAKMLASFDALPFDLKGLMAANKEWKTAPHAEFEDRLAWTRFFRDRYAEIVEMAGD
jgi:hypothetical protein